jgi:predicted transcriptional regulator
MLEALFGSINRERVLLFLHAGNQGYAREIARFFKTDLDPIQKQLERLEFGGVIYSRNAGKTKVYSLNPRYPSFLMELIHP